MKKIIALCLSVVIIFTLAACSGQGQNAATTAAPSETAAAETTAAETTAEAASQDETTEAETPVEEEPVESVMEIAYANYDFDYADTIKAELDALATVPAAADIEIEASDEKGAAGVIIVPAFGAEDGQDYYMNALVAGNKITFSAKGDAKIASAASSATSSDIAIASDGKSASFTPAELITGEDGSISDEVITVTMESGSIYNIHTVSEMIPSLVLTGEGVSADDAGIYTIMVEHVMIRLSSDREVIYFRDLSCLGQLMANNFSVSEVDGENYYAYTVVTNPELSYTGYTSGVYVVMDSNYNEIDTVTLLPNDDPNHTHGEGYLDMHEFIILGENHYLTLGYVPMLVDNLPEGIEGLDGTSSAYVWINIIQEIKDGQVINEINTADYPALYDTAVERNDYPNSTDQGTVEDIMDYVHTNSMDPVFNSDGTVKNILVSMRNQCAVYLIDMASGSIQWILGGKASTLTGFEADAFDRADTNGVEFKALTFGQHNARYTQRNSDGTVEISIFDNACGKFPFMYDNGDMGGEPTLTRMLKVAIDSKAGTANVTDIIDAHQFDEVTGKCHTSDHCGSVNYWSDSSVLIGWGLNIPIDTNKPVIANYGWAFGDHPVFTDYNEADDTVSLELTVIRSSGRSKKIEAGVVADGSLYSYRTYKNAK